MNCQSALYGIFIGVVTFFCMNNTIVAADLSENKSTSEYSNTIITGAEIFKKYVPSVVLIVGDNSLGSGVIISKNMIITNWHVIKDNPKIKIVCPASVSHATQLYL